MLPSFDNYLRVKNLGDRSIPLREKGMQIIEILR